MNNTINSKKHKEFIPQFKWQFITPKYWGVWLLVLLMIITAYLPIRGRDKFLGNLGKRVGRIAKSARRRAQINLMYCFPEKSEGERENIIDEMFAVAPQCMIMMVELSIKSPETVLKRVDWDGYQHIEELIKSGQNAIFMVPHGWAVDIPAMLLAAKGYPMAAMFHHQRNELVDYLWNYARRRFGGRMHAREDGIKPFIISIKEKYWGYYLPDQDHGPEYSEFVDFFGTYKATLPAIGKLAKVSRSIVIPLFPSYCNKIHRLKIKVLPPMEDSIWQEDDQSAARAMNVAVESLVSPDLSQYTWILKLLKTRKNGETEPYSRKELYPYKKKSD
ncbi:lauroyl-Kdo(2)-lipid IV(A) myristoyltransferase [Thorsellia anophelis]|uniref:Lipid A biosynthesis acyltransferase n=1 Tax=Thorsellia anophelis DSM 18579 TaxID=1123402 RepID=A0A1I0E5W0_9GAMM|nr:lauroyl-Kdo(2)-lipid IV(A) myristoyltransferase [Thorsellia anophelis]SET40194.1 lauroyl-KDO2-lipid IV(A) myristoyltransferase [Thorsellia anophelis DSM 18579]